MVSKGVSPGFGGIPQELWIAAPPCIRERERHIFNTIFRTGIVPEILNHRQMVFLPKPPLGYGSATASPLETHYGTELTSHQIIYRDQWISGKPCPKSSDAAWISKR
ncbi:LOW QUALITY PROTEIN: hypothetical protein PHMEG_00012561 [Phytophthora megakarya]|uniref:Uncharacterized protein n=1 Tax=Phytophthora megakarya TaxID=4795 RepID=A0A225WB00_9STRA|nr:LOW QUALITY PROTEIN: hypothetical protein PHMEG_00012561 [Phytophthora megakarya]